MWLLGRPRQEGHLDVVRLLLQAGAERDLRTDEGITAIMMAAGEPWGLGFRV